jgi:hypothetical protein
MTERPAVDAIPRRLGVSRGPLIATLIVLVIAFVASLQLGLEAKRTWDQPGLWFPPEIWVAWIALPALIVAALGGLVALRYRGAGLVILALGLGTLTGIGAGLALGQGYRVPIAGSATVRLDEPALDFAVSLACVWDGDSIADLSGEAYSQELGRVFWVEIGLEPGAGGPVPYAVQLGLVADDSTGAQRSQYEWWPSSGAPSPEAVEIEREGRSGSLRFTGMKVADPGPPGWPASLSGTVSWDCGG